MRFVELFENNRSLGKYDVPEHVPSAAGRTFRVYGATRMGGNGVVFEASEHRDGLATGTSCAVKVLKHGPGVAAVIADGVTVVQFDGSADWTIESGNRRGIKLVQDRGAVGKLGDIDQRIGRRERIKRALIDVGVDVESPTKVEDALGGILAGRTARIAAALRQTLVVGVVERVHGDADLLEVIRALQAGRRVAHFLYGRHQQRDQDCDDGDDDEQFDQRETLAESQQHGSLVE